VPAFEAMQGNEIYTPATLRGAAGEIIAVYTAWGHPEKIPPYRSYLDAK
jgi:hypothetical protein